MPLLPSRSHRTPAWLKWFRWLALPAGAAALHAAELYIAPDGNDSHSGTREAPFATIQRAQEAASAGDTVFLRGGTYRMREAHIVKRERLYAYVNLLEKSGEPGRRIILRLAPTSDAIDRGVDVGRPFHGRAPDLGAFEHRP
jgi:hypothetical protein